MSGPLVSDEVWDIIAPLLLPESRAARPSKHRRQFDWRGAKPLRPGQWTCTFHGPIEPTGGGLVPYCDRLVDGRPCMRIAWLATRIGEKVVSAEPRPRECPAGHLLGPRTVLLGWQPCQCTPAGGHRWWRCRSCPDGAEPQRWPPHDEAIPLPR